MKGWKCFDDKLQCRSYQFRIGGTYTIKGQLKMCSNGFHFHKNAEDLFIYYKDSILDTRVCEVRAINVISAENKSCCSSITILRELTIKEISELKSQYGDGSGDGSGNGDGNGDGDGSGSGSGDGSGDGSGNGDGDGSGYGSGDGSGSGSGYGDGDGSGYGSGYGYGNGNGDGDGSGSGSGYGSGDGSGRDCGYRYGFF